MVLNRMEKWKPIEEYPEYSVSDLGRVRRGSKMIKPYDGGNGYLKVSLSKDGAVKKFTVHRLVASAFCKPCPDGNDVAHWNGDRLDNRSSNLRWTTRRGNMGDTRRLGRLARGERNGGAKLTAKDVLAIRKRRVAGATYQSIANEYGVAWQSIQDACSGRNWAWLKGSADE